MAELEKLSSNRAAWQRIVAEQARLRPQWQLQDVYKLAFQAAMGSEHAVPGEPAARSWLETEVAELDPRQTDPLVEPISPDGRLVRVNLRPYLTLGDNLEGLLQAFLHTAVVWQGNRDVLQQYIDWIIEVIKTGELGFQSLEAQIYFQQLAQAGFPPAHHSHQYRLIYQPAYRVVLLDLLPFHP